MNIQNQQERRAKWESFVEEQEKSGLSQKDFCKSHDLALSQFVYYRSVFKTKKCDQVKAAELFSPIQVKKIERNTSLEIKIVLPNGFQCFVPSQIEASCLRSIMEALLSC
jgi:hypothetical protein